MVYDMVGLKRVIFPPTRPEVTLVRLSILTYVVCIRPSSAKTAHLRIQII